MTQDPDTNEDSSDKPDTTLAAATHLLGLVAWIVGPLVVLFITDDDEFVEENARNALNWQLFFGLYTLISGLLVFVLVGFALVPLVGLLDTVFCVIAAVKATENEIWEYPLTLDIV